MAVCSVCGKGIEWNQGVSCLQCNKKLHTSCMLTLHTSKKIGVHVEFCSYDCVVIWSSKVNFNWLECEWSRKGKTLESQGEMVHVLRIDFEYFVGEALSKCSDGCFKYAVPILTAQKPENVVPICGKMSSHERSTMVAETYFGDKFDKDVFASLGYKFGKFWDFHLAKKAETAGRYEDAAKIYEGMGMPAEAGRLRDRGRRVVTVDLNALISQLKEGTVYKCPTCGARIKISSSTNASQLSKCEYCGNVLRTDDLTKFIHDILK